MTAEPIQPAETEGRAPCPACGRQNPHDARFCASCGLQLTGDEEEDDDESPGSVADPLIDRVIADRYRIRSLIGRGGMGVVYQVEHVHIGKLMAMKLLHGELARDKDTVKRFKREAEAASNLSHPNTVQIFDFGRDQGLMYLVMEYLEGRDLGQIIQQEGVLTLARVARICAQVCASVAEAHSKGIVHRDLKPENIMVVPGRSRPDVVKVLDFGLAKLRHHDTGLSLTRAGSIIGTPYYMAPEHIRGEAVDPRADIYSVGAVIYKSLAGVPPFWASTPMGVLTKHLTDPLVPPSERSGRTDLPPEADAIVANAMAKDPAERYQSMDALRHDLLAYLASIGEEQPDSGVSFPRQLSVPSPSGRRKVVQVATRTDVDRYEKRIRRKGRIGWLLGVLLLAGAAAGGVWLYRQDFPRPVPTHEEEPNNEPNQANALPPHTPVRGILGKRLARTFGDADVFVLRNSGGARRPMRFEVTAIPNIDLMVEVVRKGASTPVLVADSGGVGEPEAVPNFPLVGSTYYLRVREHWERGAMPTENVSDRYRISWDFVQPGPQDEREVNDSLELAGTVGLGEVRRGFIGWAGDVDTYCLAEDGVSVVARVGAIRDVDLVLRVVDRGRASSIKIDERGVGEGELSEPIGRAMSGDTCFELSAAAAGGGRRANAQQPYELRVDQEGSP